MINDSIAAAAQALTEEEARILARFSAGEHVSDIHINLADEFTGLSQARVREVIKDKGRDNAGYSRNVVIAYRERHPVPDRKTLASAVRASRPSPYRSAPLMPNPVARALPKPAPPRSQPSTPVKRVETISSAVGPLPSDASTALPAGSWVSAAPSGPRVVEGLHHVMPPSTEATITAVADEAPPAAADEEFSLDQLLVEADAFDSENIAAGAQELRAVAERLRAAIRAEGAAAELRQQIAQVEEEIAAQRQQLDEKIMRRDELRRQLEELLSGTVIVSAAAGSLRKDRPAEGVPESDIRAWARENNMRVQPRGAVSYEVRTAYEKAMLRRDDQ